MLSVRLLTLDHYMCKPIYGLESNYEENKKTSSLPTPVLRIFGPTATGEKACVHIHGVFPYLYVPFEGSENPDRDSFLLAAGIDRALQTADGAKAHQRYVHRVRLVSGIPFYGYHSGPRQFFKVYFFNPFVIRKAADLLLSGAILNMKLQPHESHIPFTQQFMIDFNLFGMSLVNFKKVKFRRHPDVPDLLTDVNPDLIHGPEVKKASHCLIEIDVLAEDILNRLEERSVASNPGLTGLWAEERVRRRQQGRLSELTPQESDHRPPHKPFGIEVELLNDLETRLREFRRSDEPSDSLDSNLIKTPYPAEVPQDSLLLDASVLDAADADDESYPGDDAELVNVTLVHELTQRQVQEEQESSEEEEDDEGRVEEAEPEIVEAGLDMTQPLSPPVVPERQGDGSSESEEEFWKEMAEEINQLDGAGDSDDALSSWSDNVLSFLDENCLELGPPPGSQSMWDVSTEWPTWSTTSITPENTFLDLPSSLQFPDTPVSVPPETPAQLTEPIFVPKSNLPNQSASELIANLKAMMTKCDNELTLQDFLKGIVVSVDFKMINAMVMVMIEYKPYDSATSQFLVEPLYQFIEDWSKAEKNDMHNISGDLPKYIHGYTTVKPKKTPSKKVLKSNMDKSIQTSLEDNSEDSLLVGKKLYSINESVISKKKITMKLVTSPINVGDASVITNEESGTRNFDRGSTNENERPATINDFQPLSPKKEPETEDFNDNIVRNINEKFEEYYQRLMGKSKQQTKVSETVTRIKTEHEIIDVTDSSSSGDEISYKKRYVARRKCAKKKGAINPVDFVSQILSNYSSMPNGVSLPPMSITVNIGDPSLPVQVNVEPPSRGAFDGADDSSSDEAEERRMRRKKAKYKPLQILVEKSPLASAGKRRKDTFSPGSAYFTPSRKSPSSRRSQIPAASVSTSACRSEPIQEVPMSSSQAVNEKEPLQSIKELGTSHLTSPTRRTRRTASMLKDGDFIGSDDEAVIQQTDALATSSDEHLSCALRSEKKRKIRRKKLVVSVMEKSLDRKRQIDATEEQITKRVETATTSIENEEIMSGIPGQSEVCESSVVSTKAEEGLPQTTSEIDSPQRSELENKFSADVKDISSYALSSTIGRPMSNPDSVNENILSMDHDDPCDPFLDPKNNDELADHQDSKSNDSCSVRLALSPGDSFDIFDDGFGTMGESSMVVSPSALSSCSRLIKYKPSHIAPTRQEIESNIHECELLKPTGVVPHYSNFKDASKTMEIGWKALKVPHEFADLKIHNSALKLTSIEDIRKATLNEKDMPRWSLASSRKVVLTPLQKAPLRSEVGEWKKEVPEAVKVESAKIKILVPLGDGSDSGDESLSMTPCTPTLLSDDSICVTPTSQPLTPGRTRSQKRRVSFDTSAQPIVKESTPISGRRSASPGLTPIAEEPAPNRRLLRTRGRRKLLMTKLRRGSSEGNKSSDLFEGQPENQEAVSEKVNVETTEGKLENLSGTRDKSCMLQGVSLDNTFGFKASLQNLQDAKPNYEFQHTTLLIIEVLTETRGDFKSNPQLDAVLAVFYGLVRDYPMEIGGGEEFGVWTVGNPLKGAAVNVTTREFQDEKSLIENLIRQVRLWDPDIVAGYETEMGSWGYVLQRAYILSINMMPQLARPILDTNRDVTAMTDSQEEFEDVPKFIRQLRIPGRITLNVWRLLRKELALTSYTFENIMFNLLHERCYQLTPRQLSLYWQHRNPRARHLPAEYFLTRVRGTCRILAQLDLISRTSELARLFGIQFEEVLSRGSQFRVESMMLRMAKPGNFVPVSPSIQQRAHMRAPLSLPLIMEPESQFYSDPVIVLDFQSLYPSMIIAYNYCFSTCLGRTALLGRSDEPFEFGCTRLSVPPATLTEMCPGDIHISPVGVAFVRRSIRRGILPAMLEEILDTRLMVKKSMKENKGDKVLQKVLHARQLGLKLIANVTYGYTAANFSGRMPSSEIADSVVGKGRETLQRAIRLVQDTLSWNARVVYGDTDSLFVMTPGRTKEEAFRIGQEIADAVTNDNPHPVKLKLEKVYQPCILQTKKRYVGYMYESASQKTPVYEAKGIETVRRDGCPATAKVLQKALEILFETGDVSQVKKYTLKQFAKLFQGRINIKDLIFAREYRGRKGYRPGACVPALQLAKQWTTKDRRAEPRKKERVPYVIVHGAPGLPLIRLVRSPRDLLSDNSLRIHAAYYITKAIIPPMQRCFTLFGADPMTWYAEMPRRYHRMVRSGLQDSRKRLTISQYFAPLECVACGRLTHDRICVDCFAKPAVLALTLANKQRKWERALAAVLDVCKSCSSQSQPPDCISLDCPVMFRRHQIETDHLQAAIVKEILQETLPC